MKSIAAMAALAFVGCGATARVMAPAAIEEGTYKIYSPESQGTAWALDSHHAVTAGHVCDLDPLVKALWPDGVPLFTLISSQNHQVAARVVNNLYVDTLDACLLATDEELPSPLKLATEMPKTGDRVEFVGYPNGVWTHAHGEYLGDIDGPRYDWNDYATTAPCDHGASGSALVGPDGVFGILVRLRVYEMSDGELNVMPGDMGCVVSPLIQIEALTNPRHDVSVWTEK